MVKMTGKKTNSSKPIEEIDPDEDFDDQDEDSDEGEESETCLGVLFNFFLNCFFFLLFLALLAMGGYHYGKDFLKNFFNRSEIEVPSFIGLSVADVIEKKPNELKIKVDSRVFHPIIPKDNVIRQDPVPGQFVKENRTIYLTLSKGGRIAGVPSLVEKDFRDAQLILDNNGFTPGKQSFIPHPTIPARRVIAQNPESGEKQIVSESVDLLISTGPESQTFPMPDLRGKTLGKAQLILKNLGLKTKTPYFKQDFQTPPNQVIKSNPFPFSFVTLEDEVEILVSSGEQLGNAPFEVLNQFDQEFNFSQSARRVLGEKLINLQRHLNENQKNTEILPKVPNYVVAEATQSEPIQSPKPPPVASQDPKNASTTAVLSADTPAVHDPNQDKPPASGIVHQVLYQLPDGYLPLYEVRMILKDEKGIKAIHQANHPPNFTIEKKLEAFGVAQVEIWVNNRLEEIRTLQ